MLIRKPGLTLVNLNILLNFAHISEIIIDLAAWKQKNIKFDRHYVSAE